LAAKRRRESFIEGESSAGCLGVVVPVVVVANEAVFGEDVAHDVVRGFRRSFQWVSQSETKYSASVRLSELYDVIWSTGSFSRGSNSWDVNIESAISFANAPPFWSETRWMPQASLLSTMP